MQKISRRLILCLFLMLSGLASSFAESVQSLVMQVDEFEEGVGVQNMRYIINSEFLRIDNGNDSADFILFDVKNSMIFSINHEDQTSLKITYNKWSKPEYSFKVNVSERLMDDAPKIFNRPVFHYQVEAADKVCTEVYLIKDVYPDAMNVLYQYQQVLSGQQVITLKNTPADLHTPCFLVDQVYHDAEYLKQGMPVQIIHSRGYVKMLKDFKEMKLDKNLFELPASYAEYKAFAE